MAYPRTADDQEQFQESLTEFHFKPSKMREESKELTYEESREKLKYDSFKSIFFYWSSVDGIVMLTL